MKIRHNGIAPCTMPLRRKMELAKHARAHFHPFCFFLLLFYFSSTLHQPKYTTPQLHLFTSVIFPPAMRALPPSLGRHIPAVGNVRKVNVSVHPIVNVHQPPLLAQLCVCVYVCAYGCLGGMKMGLLGCYFGYACVIIVSLSLCAFLQLLTRAGKRTAR